MNTSWIDISITTFSGMLLGSAISEGDWGLGIIAVFFWFMGKPLTMLWKNNSLSQTVKETGGS